MRVVAIDARDAGRRGRGASIGRACYQYNYRDNRMDEALNIKSYVQALIRMANIKVMLMTV